MSSPLEFGISITPTWTDRPQAESLGTLADDTGLDLVGIQDHPYQWRFFETWTLIAFLAGRTSRVRFFPDVVNIALRQPAVLAKAAASLDVLTGGRVELGLGAGGFPDAVVAMGGPRRTPGQAVKATEEAIDVIRLVWSGDRDVRHEGEHHRLAGLNAGPPPAHDMGIWVGASGPRMLDLIGRKADGWVPSASWAPPTDLPRYLELIGSAARETGRDPKTIRVIYNIGGTISADGAGKGFAGPVGYWLDRLSAIRDIGVDAFIFWPGGEDAIGQARMFAEQVVPEMRAGSS